MLNNLAAKAGVSIQAIPVEFAQSTQRSDHLCQIIDLQAEEDVLKLWAIEVQANAITCGGHLRATAGGPSMSVS
jgi:hypothetical protein